jgi:hypothetical protein
MLAATIHNPMIVIPIGRRPRCSTRATTSMHRKNEH